MRPRHALISVALAIAVASSTSSCSSGGSSGPAWQADMVDLSSALLSIWGSSESDIWAVGSDGGSGPLVLHYDGTSWTPRDTGAQGDLWWVHGFKGGPVFMGGGGGLILRYQNGVFEKMTTPGVETVFGIWGASPDDVWAVGGAIGGANGAFAWRLREGTWAPATGFPAALADNSAIWKIYGRAANDAWLVGTFGKTLHWDGTAFTEVSAGIGESLFTVHANAQRFTCVGGFGTGIILENEGSGWVNVSPPEAGAINGVHLTENGGYAVGFDGSVFARRAEGWVVEDTGLEVYKTLHAVWIDPKGTVWAVGGDVLSFPLTNGVLVHKNSGG